jgi:hypothetical protein
MFTQSERDAIGLQLTKAAVFYDRADFDKSRISIMISVLEEEFGDVGAQKILDSIVEYRRDPKNKVFPSASALQGYLRPVVSTDAQAQEIAGRITESISKFGYTGGAQAKAFIGEIGWSVVQRFGGWAEICRDHGVNIQPGQFFAQTRDMIKAKIEINKAGKSDDSSLLEYKSKGEITQGQVMNLIDGLVKKTEMEK